MPKEALDLLASVILTKDIDVPIYLYQRSVRAAKAKLQERITDESRKSKAAGSREDRLQPG